MKEQQKKEEAIFKNDSEERFAVWFNIKKNHGIHLTEDQLDEIDRVYFHQQKDAIVRVGLYRLINFILGLVCVLFSLFVMYWDYQGPLCVVLFGLFTVVNLIWGINAKIDHRRLKKRQRQLKNGE